MQRKFGSVKAAILLLCALAIGAVAARGWISYGTDTTALTKPDRESPSLNVALRKYPIPRQFVTKGPAPVGKLFPDPHFRVTSETRKVDGGREFALQTLRVNGAFRPKYRREIISLEMDGLVKSFDVSPSELELTIWGDPILLSNPQGKLLVFLAAYLKGDEGASPGFSAIVLELLSDGTALVLDKADRSGDWSQDWADFGFSNEREYFQSRCTETHQVFTSAFEKLTGVTCTG